MHFGDVTMAPVAARDTLLQNRGLLLQRQLAVMKMRQTLGGADPYRTVRAGRNGGNAIVRQPAFARQISPFTVLPSNQSLIRSEPNRPIRRRDDLMQVRNRKSILA